MPFWLLKGLLNSLHENLNMCNLREIIVTLFSNIGYLNYFKFHGSDRALLLEYGCLEVSLEVTCSKPEKEPKRMVEAVD